MKKVFLSFSFCLLLAGCNPAPVTPKLPHDTVETVSHAVLFSQKSGSIDSFQKGALSDFLQIVPPNAASYILLATSDVRPASVARAKAVQNFLTLKGYDKHLIRLQPTRGTEPAAVVVTIQYAKARPPEPCPDWSKNPVFNYENTDASNFGCAYYNNLVVQLANPADYDAGRSSPKFDGSRDSVYMQRYLSGSASGTSSTATAGAAAGGSTTTTSSTP